MKVNNKTIVVTGAGSGMGRELTLQLLAKGAKIAAVDINEASLKETQTQCKDNKGSIKLFTADITDTQAISELFDRVLDEFGAVDGLINNAGIIQPFVRVKDLDYDVIERVMKINFYGTLYLTKVFLPHFLTRPEAHIVNVSSMGGFLPVPGQTIYGASKAAVKLLTEGLHSELVDTGVKVTLVIPGGVNTNIMKNSGLQLPENKVKNKKKPVILSATEAAEIIINAIETDKYRVLVGKDARMMDLFYRVNPKKAATLIAGKMKRLLLS